MSYPNKLYCGWIMLLQFTLLHLVSDINNCAQLLVIDWSNWSNCFLMHQQLTDTYFCWILGNNAWGCIEAMQLKSKSNRIGVQHAKKTYGRLFCKRCGRSVSYCLLAQDGCIIQSDLCRWIIQTYPLWSRCAESLSFMLQSVNILAYSLSFVTVCHSLTVCLCTLCSVHKAVYSSIPRQQHFSSIV